MPPMGRAISILCLGLLTIGPARAAPQDYRDKLLANVLGMTVKNVRSDDGRLVAFYGETIGRATVTISPSLAADPGGAAATGTSPTPSAQRALMQLVDQNLATGTRALGEGYATSTVRVDGLEVNGKRALCSLIERSQAEDRVQPGKERIFLLDRICAAQVGEDIVTVHVTTPMTAALRGS